MGHYNTVFNQLFNFIPRHRFENSVRQTDADRYTKQFTSWRQLLVLLYSQISGKESLREIETGLMARNRRLYHLGLEAVSRSTLSDAMTRRNAAIFEQLFYSILERAQAVAPGHKFRFKNPLYTFDSTAIDLCLSTFDWARFRKRKGAIKLHYQLDHRGHLPAFMIMTDGKGHDMTTARDGFEIVPDSIYCFDRAYNCLNWLYFINKQRAFFVTRTHPKQSYRVIGQHTEPSGKNIIDDQIIELKGYMSASKYPEKLRIITALDPQSGKLYTFMTNNFLLSAWTIAQIYRQRWQIEIFFKWIKQNLKIKTFLGTSRNAVLSQVWVAMIYYLLLAYIKFTSRVKLSITELTRRIKETLFAPLDLLEVLSLSKITKYESDIFLDTRQLYLVL